MKFSVKTTLKLGDTYHWPGSEIDLKEKDQQTINLLDQGVIAPYDPKAAKKYADSKKPAQPFEDDFTAIKGIGSDLAFAINGLGIKNFEQLGKANLEKLINLPGISEKKAKAIVSEANKLAKKRKE